jgi:hypothetical protein
VLEEKLEEEEEEEGEEDKKQKYQYRSCSSVSTVCRPQGLTPRNMAAKYTSVHKGRHIPDAARYWVSFSPGI